MAYNVSAAFNAVDNVSSIMDGMASKIANWATSSQNAASSFAGGLDMSALAASGLSAGLGILADVGATVITFMEDEGHAMAAFKATTDASAETVGAFKKQSEDLFSTGLVDNITEATALVGEMQRQLTDLGNWSPDQLTANIAGISKAWDVNGKQMIDDIADITNKFDDLAGKPDVVTDTLVRMAQVTGEPIDALSKAVVKIGNQLAAAGLSGSNSMALIAQAANNGVTNFGPLGGAIQKFHDQLINPPAGFSKAIHDLGLEDVAKKAKAGGISMDETLEIIFAKLDKIKDPAQRAQLAIELFGKGSEKAFGDNIGKMAGFTNALGDVEGAADKVAKIMEDDGTLGTAMKHLYNQGLVNVNAGFDNIYHILKDTDWGGLGIDFKNLLLPGLIPIEGVLDTIGGMIDRIKKGLAEINAAGGSFTKGSGQGSGGGHAGFGGQAAGGMMGEGWGWVGEEGPELRYKHGASVEVFSASESRKMVQGSGAAAGGSGASITITGNTFVGTGGMAELGRLITPYLQQESQRRIERT